MKVKKRKRLVWLPFLLATLLATVAFVKVWGAKEEAKDAAVGTCALPKNILVAGVDEAGHNTDLLILCRIDASGRVSILQIPRDTYYRNADGKGKINRIYRVNSSKRGGKIAAESLSDEISNAFSVQIDGYMVFDTQTVGDLVDLLGGVSVDVPRDIPYFDGETGEEKVIRKGVQKLYGREAVAFVRHRKSYAEGDLGRLDAHMRFFSGVFDSLPSLYRLDSILGVYKKILPNLLTNLREKDIIEVMMALLKKRDSLSLQMMRLPGEACYTDGVSYYVLHRAATARMLSREFGVTGEFDEEKRFTDDGKEAFRSIYTFPDPHYRTYTQSEGSDKRILNHRS